MCLLLSRINRSFIHELKLFVFTHPIINKRVLAARNEVLTEYLIEIN